MICQLYDPCKPVASFAGTNFYEVPIDISTPSGNIKLQVKRIDLVSNKIFVLLEAIYPNGIRNCAIGPARLDVKVQLPQDITPSQVDYFIMNKGWNWGAENKIADEATYLQMLK